MCRKRPYEGQHQLQVIQSIAQGRLPKFRRPSELTVNSLDKTLRDGLELICAKCWSRDPADRPSMGVLQQCCVLNCRNDQSFGTRSTVELRGVFSSPADHEGEYIGFHCVGSPNKTDHH